MNSASNPLLTGIHRVQQALESTESGCIGHFGEVLLHSAFQPIVSLAHCRTVGYEGLVRAKQYDGRAVLPQDLFGQDMGEDKAVHLDRLCRGLHIKNFVNAGRHDCWLFLNVSPVACVRGRHYGEFFGDFLAHIALPPERVVIEVLENPTLNDQELANSVAFYRELGCLVAIDDFGVGHSNFGRVWQIKPEIIKLDRSTLISARQDSTTRRMLPGLVCLLHEAGSIVLIEGVEDEFEAMLALECGADLAQGYYFGRPAQTPAAQRDSSDTIRSLVERYSLHTTQQREENRYALIMSSMCEAIHEIRRSGTLNCQAVTQLLQIARVERCYLLDESGCQVEKSRTASHRDELRDARFSPLDKAEGAVWMRRSYWERALARPNEIQTTRPYLSVATGRLCVTLSTCFSSANGWLVLCCDIDHHEGADS
jgi:EAL domain-containing protein (putative c-di-GMP-specific phosphodiesterase class I)